MTQESNHSLNPQPARFLTPNRQAELESITRELSVRLADTAHQLVESGRLLIRAKRLLGHGHFRKWLSENFSMSAKTANRFMAVAAMVEKLQLENDTVSLLLQLDLKTLYELAAKSTTEAVQREVLGHLQQENLLSFEQLRALKQSGQAKAAEAGPELLRFTQRLQQLSLWFESNRDWLRTPGLELEARLRADLRACAESLRFTTSIVDEILRQTPPLPLELTLSGDGHAEPGKDGSGAD